MTIPLPNLAKDDTYSLERAKLDLDTGYQASENREDEVQRGKKQQKIS